MSTDECAQGKGRSFLNAREPSIDYRSRPRPPTEFQVKLFPQGIAEGNEENEDKEESSVESLSSVESGDRVLVYLRLRPVEMASSAYRIAESTLVTQRPASAETHAASMNNKNNMEKQYKFSAIFDGDVEQQKMYNICIELKIECDESFTVLTYGTSGSGKTFTLLGDDLNPGIIPRSLENIFTIYANNIYPNPSIKLVNARATILDDEAIAKESQCRRQLLQLCDETPSQYSRMQEIVRSEHAFETTNLSHVSVLIWVSFVEIYNELLFDLLALAPSNISGSVLGPPSKSLKIIGNDGKVFVKGLTSVYVKSSLEALKLLRYGLRRVNYASTAINANSSRSHCIFTVDVIKYFNTGLITETSYKFCDLAGSERLHKTGNIGSRLKEAQCINTSLMVLGRCLDAAGAARKKPNEMIPYRESKLTMLLQAALLGKEKLTMIVNVTPTEKYFEENLNVLSFAAIAKNIIFKQPVAKRNNSRYSFFLEVSKPSVSNNSQIEYLEQLLEENKSLRDELDRLNIEMNLLRSQRMAELLQQEIKLRNELVDSYEITLQKNKQQFETRLKQELLRKEREFESKIASLKRKHEYDIEDLRDEYESREENEPSTKRNTLE